MERGDPIRAQMWFDRACKLAPGHPLATFMLASAMANLEDKTCIAILTDLVAQYPDFREAILGLVSGLHRTQQPACGTLGCLLSSATLPPDPVYRKLASDVATQEGWPGWCSLDGTGQAIIGRVKPASKQRLEASIGSIPFACLVLDKTSNERVELALPPNWRSSNAILVTLDGNPLLGSPIDATAMMRTDAIASIDTSGVLSGWAWHPRAPDITPRLVLQTPDGRSTPLTLQTEETNLPWNQIARTRKFAPFTLAPQNSWAARVTLEDGRDVLGSPCHYRAPARAQRTRRPRPSRRPPQGLDVVIPVLRGAGDLADCLNSIEETLPERARIVIVDDGATEPDIVALLASLERAGTIVLRHVQNRGFPEAVNTALAHAGPRRDVILLNPDTLAPKGWIEHLLKVAYSQADIGSVTPLTNEGSIVSYPDKEGGNPALNAADLEAANTLCRRANGFETVDLPTGIGFCMLLRHDCIAQTGLFNAELFANGYGEENDWCRRAARLGWRHVAATGLLVSHIGNRTFGGMREALSDRNIKLLNSAHSGYDQLIQEFIEKDPLSRARRQIDLARWPEPVQPACLLITHHLGGGVERVVKQRCRQLVAKNVTPVVLRPFDGSGRGARLEMFLDPTFPNLIFKLPHELSELMAVLEKAAVDQVEFHHGLGHSPIIRTIAPTLGVPYDVYVHDFASVCGRITLCGPTGRYCGEPLLTSVCDICVATLGNLLTGAPSVSDLRADTQLLLDGARQVIAPSNDAARRIRRFVRSEPTVTPWQDDRTLPAKTTRPPSETIRVVLVGGINRDKGFDVLLSCAQEVLDRGLPLEFGLMGYSIDDPLLLKTGRVFVTGPFKEEELGSLIVRYRPHVGLLPSVCPETWCFSLTALWNEGLNVLAFNLGAQAERIKATGRGELLPVGVPTKFVLDRLIAMHAQDRAY